MQLLKKIMALVLVTLWSLASNHCKIEQLTTTDFLGCCNSEIATGQPASDCDTDNCATLEGGIYKTEDGQLAFHAPALVKIYTLQIADSSASQKQPEFLASVSPPPEISVGWQFISRTAAEPRSPSFVSRSRPHSRNLHALF